MKNKENFEVFVEGKLVGTYTRNKNKILLTHEGECLYMKYLCVENGVLGQN